MSTPKYSAETAAQEHLLEGKPLTRLEAMVLFGVISLDFFDQRILFPHRRSRSLKAQENQRFWRRLQQQACAIL